jgi:hypothetical protein
VVKRRLHTTMKFEMLLSNCCVYTLLICPRKFKKDYNQGVTKSNLYIINADQPIRISEKSQPTNRQHSPVIYIYLQGTPDQQFPNICIYIYIYSHMYIHIIYINIYVYTYVYPYIPPEEPRPAILN